MKKINILDQITVDKIAAGEVVERPASVAKELIENAIDAGASSIIIEIEDGGMSSICVSDNGEGIDKDDIRNAFLRHSTSKIKSDKDLFSIHTLGFRGEALSSIAAVSMVNIKTKTREASSGMSYTMNGGEEQDFSEVGAPQGTTFLVQQLFYNTPARKKFLKSAITESSHISDLVTRLALSHPEISFHFISNGSTKLQTSGSLRLKDVVYQIYGREIATNLLEVNYQRDNFSIQGVIGKPQVSRGNRSYENFFVNGRYVKSQLLSKATEDAYKDYTMQHRYPFVVLFIEEAADRLDVNVHPTKMEVRFLNTQNIYNSLYEALYEALREKELIPEITPPVMPKVTTSETNSGTNIDKKENPLNLDFFMEEMKKRVKSFHEAKATDPYPSLIKESVPPIDKETFLIPINEQKKPVQLNFFEEKIIPREIKQEYRLIGQLFETYWLIEYKESLYIIDQHAAHERVLYEETLNQMKTREHTSQMISPPIVLELSMKEAVLLRKHLASFLKIGFEISEFGEESFIVNAIPGNLFSIGKKKLLMDMIDSLSDEFDKKINEDIIDEKIASMSCKAAVKGNMRLSEKEMDALIGKLLVLENPYHCPHGRPTIISMTKKELEKKFKRIV